jgi:hypothetical protein
MTIAIVSAGRIRVARNSIQLPNLWVKDILTQATENAHYAVNHYHEVLCECSSYPDPAVIQGSVNKLIQVAGPMLPKDGPESKISKKTPGTLPRELASVTQVFVV